VVGLNEWLVLSGILFLIGAVGVLTRSNGLILFMALELMLNAVNLTFVALARYTGRMEGHVFVFLVTAVAACEAAVGLALFVGLFRLRRSVDVDQLNAMGD
jgi:NADH-quinone oxidoreductase subunit K